MFKFMSHLFAQSRWVWIGFIAFDDPYANQVRAFG
jgi:hypothetical protein